MIDSKLLLPPRFAQPPRRGQAGHASAEDGDAPAPGRHRGVMTRARASSSSAVHAPSENGRIACSSSGFGVAAQQLVQVERDPQLEGPGPLRPGEVERGAQLRDHLARGRRAEVRDAPHRLRVVEAHPRLRGERERLVVALPRPSTVARRGEQSTGVVR